jgi:hypothetical protein
MLHRLAFARLLHYPQIKGCFGIRHQFVTFEVYIKTEG